MLNIGVGKTSILNQYINEQFSNKYHPTIGAEFGAKTIEINDNSKLRLQIWDTVLDFILMFLNLKYNKKAGQESFASITKSFYRNSHCIFFVYDINK